MALYEKRETCGKSSPFVCYSAFLSLSTNNKKLVRSANEKKQRRASSFQMGSLFTSSHPSLMSLPLVFFFVVLQLLSVVNGRNQSEPSYTPLNRDLYRSSGVLANEIKTLVGRHPDILSMEKMTAQNKGYNAEIFVVTYNSSRKAFNESSKFRILLSFGQHGRELITSELAVQLLSALCKEKSIPNVDVSSLNDLLEMIVLKVVPIENLNGRKLVEAGNLCERRNGRGVDLNRNWGVDWGKKEKDYDPHEENPGTAPFSEPETQIMRKLSKSFDPHIWITIHSGMEALFMPYDHRNTTPDGLATHVMKSMLDDVNRLHCKDRCLVGSGGGSVGYLAHGTATDYMYDVMKVPMAFTFEIYGDKLASSNDCFRMFNPIDRTSFNRVLNDWTAALFTMFKMGPHWMDLAHFNSSKLESIDEYLEGYLIERSSRYGKRMEVIDLGMQEIRMYFRLFLLSSVLLMFMFCSRITKSKYATLRTAVSL